MQHLCASPDITPTRIELGDIPQRAPAPEFSFERFFRTRELAQVEFSPDKRALYVLRNDGRVENLFAIDLADGTMRQVTHFAEPVSHFAVDHRGRFVVIVKDVAGNESYDLYRYDLASGATLRLTRAGKGDTSMLCGVAPDDRHVYYAQTRDNRSEAGIWQVDARSGETRELLPGNGRTLECDHLSGDGRLLAYGELRGFGERRLGVLDLESGAAHTISAAQGINNVDADFAGHTLYFRSALASNGFRLWRYRMGDAAPQRVQLPFDNDIESFSLDSDGRAAIITCRTALAGRTAVFIDGVDVTDRLGVPSADIVGAKFSRDDPALGVVFTENATQPRRYYLVDGHAGGGAPQLIYDANRSGIDSRDLAAARSSLVRSFDGLPLPVHLFIPNGTSARAPRPAIVLIHGGPDDHVDPRYLSDVQFLANRGFIVVTPNVRGSTGFGKRFAALDDGDWGGAHVRDTVAVARFLRTLDFVDADSLFVAGFSFGGFSVMSLVTQYPRVFRAAVDFFGFTELASFVTSWPRYLRSGLLEALGFDPRIERRRNWLTSPLYHVDRIGIPLQIHQGANDSRVPRTQSDWLVQRLREQGRTVEYYVYADEGHGFTRFDNERLAYQRMVAFLRRFLHPA